MKAIPLETAFMDACIHALIIPYTLNVLATGVSDYIFSFIFLFLISDMFGVPFWVTYFVYDHQQPQHNFQVSSQKLITVAKCRYLVSNRVLRDLSGNPVLLNFAFNITWELLFWIKLLADMWPSLTRIPLTICVCEKRWWYQPTVAFKRSIIYYPT